MGDFNHEMIMEVYDNMYMGELLQEASPFDVSGPEIKYLNEFPNPDKFKPLVPLEAPTKPKVLNLLTLD